jgi:hypothetical protein
MQEYMGDEDGVDQVKEEVNGVVTLGGDRTRIYMGDADGVGQVKKEDEGVKLGRGWTCIDIGRVWWFRPQNHRRGLVVPASKPSEDGLVVCVSKPNVDGLVG